MKECLVCNLIDIYIKVKVIIWIIKKKNIDMFIIVYNFEEFYMYMYKGV